MPCVPEGVRALSGHDEVNQVKGMVEVTIDEKGVCSKIIPLKPKRDLIKLTGKYEAVLHYPNNENDFIAVELLDKQMIGHGYERLKEKYPHLLQLTYKKLDIKGENHTASYLDMDKNSPLDIFKEFYEKMKGEEMDSKSQEIIEELLEEDALYDAH